MGTRKPRFSLTAGNPADRPSDAPQHVFGSWRCGQPLMVLSKAA
jgi:hypothetical protein